MAKDINTVTITGRLTRDPELKYTADAVPVLEIGLAVNGIAKDADGYKDDPSFFQVRLFGTRAENLMKLISKG